MPIAVLDHYLVNGSFFHAGIVTMLKRKDELRRALIHELRSVDSEHESADSAFNRIVMQIANDFETDVCSIYLLESDGTHLLLVGTVGLLQSCVGHLRMQTSEGLVGLVAEQRAPVVLAEAPQHPRFRYFPEADEGQYHSFLGVPVVEGGRLRGVLVVQTIEPRTFTKTETLELARVAKVLVRRWSALGTPREEIYQFDLLGKKA